MLDARKGTIGKEGMVIVRDNFFWKSVDNIWEDDIMRDYEARYEQAKKSGKPSQPVYVSGLTAEGFSFLKAR